MIHALKVGKCFHDAVLSPQTDFLSKQTFFSFFFTGKSYTFDKIFKSYCSPITFKDEELLLLTKKHVLLIQIKLKQI